MQHHSRTHRQTWRKAKESTVKVKLKEFFEMKRMDKQTKDHKISSESGYILQVEAENVYYSRSVAFRDTLTGGFLGFVVHLENMRCSKGKAFGNVTAAECWRKCTDRQVWNRNTNKDFKHK